MKRKRKRFTNVTKNDISCEKKKDRSHVKDGY